MQTSALIQERTSPLKFDKFRRKIPNSTASNLSTKTGTMKDSHGYSGISRPRPTSKSLPARMFAGYLSQTHQRNRPRRVVGVTWNKQAFSPKILKKFIEIFWIYLVWSGAQDCRSCRSRKMLKMRIWNFGCKNRLSYSPERAV